MAFGLTRKQTIALMVTVATLVAAVAVAWLLELRANAEDGEVYRIAIVRDEDTIRTFSVEELRELPTRTLKMQGEVQEGPALLDVLEKAGITEFNSVVVTGLGVRDTGRIVLSADDISEDVLLDFSIRGSVKVCGPDIVWEDRVRDVVQIQVR